jgi:hypothetical protein
MSPKSLQSAFFASMADPQAFRLMFDQQPNVFFFVKDRESRLIAASEPTWTRLGLEDESGVTSTRSGGSSARTSLLRTTSAISRRRRNGD